MSIAEVALRRRRKAAEGDRPRRVVPAASTVQDAGQQERPGIVFHGDARLRLLALARRVGGALEPARLVGGADAEAPHVVEGNLRTGREQACRLVEADLLRCRAGVEEAHASAGPQALALADDRGRVGAVDATTQEAARKAEGRVEGRDLCIRHDLRRELVERVLIGREIGDIEQTQSGPARARRFLRRAPH